MILVHIHRYNGVKKMDEYEWRENFELIVKEGESTIEGDSFLFTGLICLCSKQR